MRKHLRELKDSLEGEWVRRALADGTGCEYCAGPVSPKCLYRFVSKGMLCGTDGKRMHMVECAGSPQDGYFEEPAVGAVNDITRFKLDVTRPVTLFSIFDFEINGNRAVLPSMGVSIPTHHLLDVFALDAQGMLVQHVGDSSSPVLFMSLDRRRYACVSQWKDDKAV